MGRCKGTTNIYRDGKWYKEEFVDTFHHISKNGKGSNQEGLILVRQPIARRIKNYGQNLIRQMQMISL